MSRIYRYCLSLAVLCALLPTAAGAKPSVETVPPDSFILQHSASLADLHQQISLDPVVRRRLARHFHISGPALVRYVQNNLVLKKTTGVHWYPVYCVAPDGHEYVLHSRVAAGTPVFVLRTTGQPILKLACGNPMTAALPVMTAKRRPQTAPQMASVGTKRKAVLAQPALSANLLKSSELSPTVGSSVGTPIMHVSPYIDTLAKKPGSHGFPLAYLAAVPLAAGLGSGQGSHPVGVGFGGPVSVPGGSLTPTGSKPGSGTGPGGGTEGVSPVPEPSSTTAFIIGGGGLLLLLVRARRRA